MGFGGLIITNNGRIELAKAESWEKELKFNYISIGDGKASGSYASRTKLSNELYQLPILKKERIDETLILTADFSNINVEQPFYLREIGIYVNDILYVYDNAGDDAEYIETGGSAVTKEKRIQCALTISSAAKVSVNLKSGLYALQKDMELMQRPEYNNSDVVEELESGESIFNAFGKIKKAVSTLISHLRDCSNPHGITKTQIGLGNTDNTADKDKNVLSAKKLAVPVNINDTPFDGSANIRMNNAWSLSLGSIPNLWRHTTFATMSSKNISKNIGATLLITDCGSYKNKYTGVWIVQISNIGSTPNMSVTQIMGTDMPFVEFGYYVDTDNSKFCFGVYSAGRSDCNITVYRNTDVIIEKTDSIGTSTPDGWVKIMPRVLQDNTQISNSTAITATGTHALDAVEKNASVSGTLANQIATLNTKLSFLNVTDITVTTNPNFPISVYSCVKYGKLVVFSFAVMAGEIGPYKTMAQLQGVTSRNTVFSTVTCFGGADAEVSIGAGSNTVAFSSSKLGGQAKGELIFICN